MESDTIEDTIVEGIIEDIITSYIQNHYNKQPCRDSIRTGHMYYEEIMNGNGNHFREICRMDKDVFQSILRELNITGSRNICWGVKLIIFLSFIGNICSNRQLSEQFQHSGETRSRIIHEVLERIMKVTDNYIKLQTYDCPEEIQNNPKFFPFFKNCIGALDGTHIPAVVPEAAQGPFRSRKGHISQNVLAVCNLDLTFSYILARWEGSAHDGRVLTDALTKGLPIIEGKYYLGDAGYSLKKYCLTPYRGVRYHLKEWGKAGERPSDKKELFNLRHSSLRNAIQRIFGILKKRFPILGRMLPYDFDLQVQLVKAVCTIHNMIKRFQKTNDCFDDYEVEMPAQSFPTGESAETDKAAETLRDEIASAIWTQHSKYTQRLER